jgi:methylated-DNA-protein-cysteine methyltransferase-like protein
MKNNTFTEIYNIVKDIPIGSVSTYGQIATLSGNPRRSRIVGCALHVNPSPETIPCHRVVFKDGTLAKGYVFGGEEVQRSLLENEGVIFTIGGKVDLDECLWDGEIG